METWKTKNCMIYQVLKGRSNSFLVNQGNDYILIDTGRGNSWKILSDRLNNILEENLLSCLILTHAHFDHAENAASLKKEYNCRIIVHENEAENLKHGTNILPKGTNPLTRLEVKMLGKLLQSHYNYELTNPDIIVREKYDLNRFKINAYILHTPGHSPGSMSIIIDNEIALVGDTMFGVFSNSAYPPFADDPETMIKSWKKLLETDCRLFLPGHGKPISRELLEKQYKKHIKIKE